MKNGNGSILSFELGEVKIPEILEKRYIKYKARHPEGQGKLGEDFDFMDWWLDQDIEPEYEGKIVDEEIAEFVVSVETMSIPSGGGYPIDGRIEFEDNGSIYTIIAYGWTSTCEESKGDVSFIGFKRKSGGKS